MYVIRYDEKSQVHYLADVGFTPNLQSATVFSTTDELIRHLLVKLGSAKGQRSEYPGTYTIIKVEMGALHEVSKIS